MIFSVVTLEQGSFTMIKLPDDDLKTTLVDVVSEMAVLDTSVSRATLSCPTAQFSLAFYALYRSVIDR